MALTFVTYTVMRVPVYLCRDGLKPFFTQKRQRKTYKAAKHQELNRIASALERIATALESVRPIVVNEAITINQRGNRNSAFGDTESRDINARTITMSDNASIAGSRNNQAGRDVNNHSTNISGVTDSFNTNSGEVIKNLTNALTSAVKQSTTPNIK